MNDLCSGNVPCVVVFGSSECGVVCAGVDKGRVVFVGPSGCVLPMVA